jgi:hypothetical protein
MQVLPIPHPVRSQILLLIVAIVATAAPIARADGDTEVVALVTPMIEQLCPDPVSGLLQEEEISAIVTDRAAFTTKVCQRLIHATANADSPPAKP